MERGAGRLLVCPWFGDEDFALFLRVVFVDCVHGCVVLGNVFHGIFKRKLLEGRGRRHHGPFLSAAAGSLWRRNNTER